MKVALAAALTALAVAAAPAIAQGWPTKPIRVVVPWPPGGGVDILTRVLADPLAAALNQSMVIENRGGANGLIGAEAVARATPDGYTIMVHSVTSHMLNPSYFAKRPYDTINDFETVGLLGSLPIVIVAHPSLPVKSLAGLIALAKKQPGQLSWASFGPGSISHIAGVLFDRAFGIQTVHIPYKGGGPALIDVLGGHVPVYFSGIAVALPHIKAGKLRALAVTSPTRSKLLPDVPTVDEAGGSKGYEAEVMYGIWVPAKTSPDIVKRLNTEVVRLLNNPDFLHRFLTQGGVSPPPATSPADMLAYIKSNMPKLAQLVKDTGVRIE